MDRTAQLADFVREELFESPRAAYACVMRRGRLGVVAIIAVLAWACSVTSSSAAQLPTPGNPVGAIQTVTLGKGATPLEGPWQFHLGDDPQWAATSFDDAGWERLTADQPWGKQGHPGDTGYAWYRLHLSLRVQPGQEPPAILVPHLDDVYEVFWNGRGIGRNGKFPPYPVWLRSSDPPAIHSLGPELEGTLAIRVWKSPLLTEDSELTGGFEGVPIVGERPVLEAYKHSEDYDWLRTHQFQFNLNLLYGIVAVLSLIPWLRDRTQWSLLQMTGFAAAPVLRLFLFGMRFPWPVGLTSALGEPVSSLRDICLWYLLLWLLHLDDQPRLLKLTRRLAVVSLTATTLDGILSLLDASVSWFWAIQIADGLLTIVYFVTAALPLLLVGMAAARFGRLDSARRMVAIAAFLSGMVQVVQGLAPQGRRFTHWTLADRMAGPLFHFNGNAVSLPMVTGTLLLLAIVYAVYRVTLEGRRRQSTLEQELRGARELQQVLIPESLPFVPGYALTSAYLPAAEVGGDFFQIIPLENQSTLIVLGDVSGKGLKAAMAVSLIVGLLRVLAERKTSPAALLEDLNKRLCGRLQGGFATCAIVSVNARGEGTLATAGHPAPYLNHREVQISGSFPLGLFPSADYEQVALRLRLNDHLALYTDGLLEARSRSGELYGFDRVAKLFSSRPNAAEAADAAVHFGQDDDITVVTLTRVNSGDESSAMHVIDRSL